MHAAADDPEVDPSPDTPVRELPSERYANWFRIEYPRIVGLVRRVLDPLSTTPASLQTAEELTRDAFVRARTDGDPTKDASARTAVICRALDQCLERLTGHPGSVPMHDELLGPDIEFDGELPLAELHDALSGLRRGDRRAGLLGFAAGASPSEVASLLGRPLDEILERLGRVATRLADGRRVGLVDARGFDLT